MSCALHRSLAEAADSDQLLPVLRAAARCHQRETFAALLRLQDKLGHSPRIAQLLFQSCAVTGAGPSTVH